MDFPGAKLFFDPFAKLAFWLTPGEAGLRELLGSVALLNHVIKLWPKSWAYKEIGTTGTINSALS